jgi:riboflavin synthase
MFTGIVEELGTVAALEDHRLEVECGLPADGTDIGASIAVNGVCLTVVERPPTGLAFDLSEETIARTSLRRLVASETGTVAFSCSRIRQVIRRPAAP